MSSDLKYLAFVSPFKRNMTLFILTLSMLAIIIFFLLLKMDLIENVSSYLTWGGGTLAIIYLPSLYWRIRHGYFPITIVPSWDDRLSVPREKRKDYYDNLEKEYSTHQEMQKKMQKADKFMKDIRLNKDDKI